MTNPSNQLPAPQYQSMDSEISMVDLAVVLVKRRRLMAGVFLLVAVSSIAFALIKAKTHTYASVYQVAEQLIDKNIVPIESANGLVARAESYYINDAARQILEKDSINNLGFKVKAQSPESSGPSNTSPSLFVTLTSDASEEDAERVARLHDLVLKTMLDDQNGTVQQIKSSLLTQLEFAQTSLQGIKQSPSSFTGELSAALSTQIGELQMRLAYLKEGRVEKIAARSLQPTGMSKPMILAVGLMLAAMLAVMSAFVMEFVAEIRQRIKLSA